MENKVFNIRVYGIILNGNRELLIAEEFHLDTYMFKLPGGGLEYGEGTSECITRELHEELGVHVTEATHFYTTDFFIESAFYPGQQVIAIYYMVKTGENLTTHYRDKFEKPSGNGQENFRWVALKDLDVSAFTFASDRVAIDLLLKKISV